MLTFDNGSLVVTPAQAWEFFQATAIDNIDDGDYYFEISSSTDDQAAFGAGVFRHDLVPSTSTAFFVSPGSFAFYANELRIEGNSGASATTTANQRLGIRVRMTNNRAQMTFYVDGQEVAGGVDIDTGTDGHFYPTVAGNGSATITAYFSEEDINFLPAGSTAWDDGSLENPQTNNPAVLDYPNGYGGGTSSESDFTFDVVSNGFYHTVPLDQSITENGTYYVEFNITGDAGAGMLIEGHTETTAPFWLGSGTTPPNRTIGYFNGGIYFQTGRVQNLNSIAATDVLGMAYTVNGSNKSIQYYLNGNAIGTPVTLLDDNWIPAITIRNGTASITVIGDDLQFLPDGASPWEVPESTEENLPPIFPIQHLYSPIL